MRQEESVQHCAVSFVFVQVSSPQQPTAHHWPQARPSAKRQLTEALTARIAKCLLILGDRALAWFMQVLQVAISTANFLPHLAINRLHDLLATRYRCTLTDISSSRSAMLAATGSLVEKGQNVACGIFIYKIRQ